MVDQMLLPLESLLCMMEDDDCQVLGIMLSQTLQLEPMHEAMDMLQELKEVFVRRGELEYQHDDAVELRKLVKALLFGYPAVT